MLARAAGRQREIAVRLALGASRGRLFRQLMAESSLLAGAGAALGLFLSSVLSQFLVALLDTQGNPLFLDLEPDWRALAFAVALAGVTCVLFGLTPALRATRTPPVDAMKTGCRTQSARERMGLRQALVVSQVALSLLLLVTALLFSGSLRNLRAVDAGFDQKGLLIANVDFSRLNIASASRLAFRRDVLGRMRALPGVASAAEGEIVPLSGSSSQNGVWSEAQPADPKLQSNFNWIGADYVKTMGMTLLAGREFDHRDRATSPKVAIVNQSFAHRLGFGADVVGRKFRRKLRPRSRRLPSKSSAWSGIPNTPASARSSGPSPFSPRNRQATPVPSCRSSSALPLRPPGSLRRSGEPLPG